ncbi:recombinase family protein [Psychrobacter sp. TWP2-1-2]|uniref:recombinase family protein n=1 Tax=Psychrobacter sp. TWP2-1-2 TaxID=2804623 RepID=UPI003CF23FE8
MKVGYARVSTKDQNLQLQLDALNAIGCDKIFTDKTSAVKQRVGLDGALSYLRDGDTLVVWKLDRLCRSLNDLINISKNLEQRKITLISLTESIDTSTPIGRLYYSLLGALAQMERELIQERIKAGIKASKRKNGRPPSMDAEKIATAETLIKSGMSHDDIAKQLNVSRSTLYKYCPIKDQDLIDDDSIEI